MMLLFIKKLHVLSQLMKKIICYIYKEIIQMEKNWTQQVNRLTFM